MKEKSQKGDQGAEIIDEMTTKAHEVIHRYKGRRDCFEVRIESGETKRLDFMLIIPTLSNRRPKKKTRIRTSMERWIEELEMLLPSKTYQEKRGPPRICFGHRLPPEGTRCRFSIQWGVE